VVSARMEASFTEFYADLKATEKKDSTLTPKQQIDRLLKPGSSYRNLNPYEVLQVDPDLDISEIKKKYRRLSILVHPDKNRDDTERAQAAFDALKKAYELLEEPETRKKCYEIVEEARGRTSMNIEEKRNQKRKQAKARGLPLTGENIRIDEDDPEKYKHAVHVLTMKLFADCERKRRDMENKISEDANRLAEEEKKATERKDKEKEFAKNWEESRQGRVNSWLNFTGKKGPNTTKSQEAKAAASKDKGPEVTQISSSVAGVVLQAPTEESGYMTGFSPAEIKKHFLGQQQKQQQPQPPLPPGPPGSRPPMPQTSYSSYPPMPPGRPNFSQPPPPIPGGQRPKLNFPPPDLPPGAPGLSGASTTSSYYASTSSNKASGPVFKEKKKKKEKKFNPLGFRPPKHKPESR